MRITFLGTGTSHGVPRIACRCPVCLSTDPHNKRLRPSALLSLDGHNVVIDTSTDFRTQMLAFPVKSLDAILLTHRHADHIMGLDDVRAFSDVQGPIPLFADQNTARSLQQVFAYVFEAHNRIEGIPRIDLHIVTGPFDLFGHVVIPVPVHHGRETILGFRIGNFAYLTDASAIPEPSLELLGNLDVLVLDALRFRPHPTHFSVDEAVEMAQIIRPRRTLLTHICHDLDHETTSSMLPPDVQLAWDGLTLDLP